MNILVAFNSDYFMAARVLQHSILKHNSCQITMYVMYIDLTQQEILQFKDDADKSGHAEVVFIKIGEEQFDDAPLHCKWITKETYYRLLAQELMPEGMERFLYLDVDMVVMDSLEEFYHQDFEGKLLVACNAKKQGEIDPKILEQRTLPPDMVYFNAGTLLYNLKAQREMIDPQILHEYLV